MFDLSAAGWTDTHCHLHDLEGASALLNRATEANVNRLICIGTSAASSASALDLARTSTELTGVDPGAIQLFATIGQHPHDAEHGIEGIVELLASSQQVPRGLERPPGSVVGVGECGLDYHYEYSPREIQQRAFAEQIALAKTYGLTLVIHTREAWEDTFAILRSEGCPEKVIIHCFTGGPEEAQTCLDLGAYLSFSGIVTFKNADDIREAVDLCPIDRLLIETDAPYLSPVPHRGSPNEPAFVAIVGEAIAALKGVDIDQFAFDTTTNATEAFGLSS